MRMVLANPLVSFTVNARHKRRVDGADGGVADGFEEIGAPPLIASHRRGGILEMLGLKVGLDQPAQHAHLRYLRLVRFGDGADTLTLYWTGDPFKLVALVLKQNALA